MENVKPLDSSDFQVLIKKYSRFLIEIRKRLIFTVLAFVAGTTIGFIYFQNIIRLLVDVLSLKGVNVVFTSPFQFINLSISCGVATGLIIAFPLIIIQLMSFLRPALRPREYKMVLGLLPLCILLFIAGFSLGALIMKWQIEIFLNQSMSLGIGNVLDISHLLSVIIITSTLMGLVFQTPIILLLLLRIGILKHPNVSKARPWVYLGSFVFAILLPPDSILADVFLSLPLVILFELTLILDKILERKRTVQTVMKGV